MINDEINKNQNTTVFIPFKVVLIIIDDHMRIPMNFHTSALETALAIP